MKDTIKLFSVITGIFRSIMTILFLLGVVFTVLVDVELLVAFLDLLGFAGVSKALVKPIVIVGLIILFIVNLIITKHVFKAANTGEYHLSNFVFGLLFLAMTAFIYITFRNATTNLIYIFFALNGLLVVNSLLGLIAKTRGSYKSLEDMPVDNKNFKKTNYIEFDSSDSLSNDLTNKDPNPIKKREENKVPNVKISNITANDRKTQDEDFKTNKAKESNIPKDTKIVFESRNKDSLNQSLGNKDCSTNYKDGNAQDKKQNN